MSTAAADPNLSSFSSKVSVRSQSLGRSFEVFKRRNTVQQSEFQVDADGTLVFRETESIDWVIGAGLNGYSFLSGRKGHLVEAPVSFYSREKKWDLSPDYEQIDMGFDRPVTTACLSCHSGRLLRPLQADGGYDGTPFQELSIGCESCHGPGERHMLARSKGSGTIHLPDTTIVNPGKLPRRLAENICMFCHEGGDARVLQPGKNEQDFRPGAWLNETIAIFKLPAKKNSARESDLLEHHYSLQLSECFRDSKAQISCFTCHDVHHRPAPDQQAQYYRAKCLGCHAVDGCSLPEKQRGEDNCIGCHMPKRDLREISHSALTNHRIVRRPDEPLPESAYLDGGPADPGLIHLNAPEEPPGLTPAPLPPLVLLQAYGELQTKDSALKVQFRRVLEAAAKLHSTDALFEVIAGQEMLNDPAANNSDAVKLLSAGLAGGMTGPSVYLDLATALVRDGKSEAAMETLKAGTVRHPFSASLHKELIARLIKSQRHDLAADEIKKYLDLFPQDSLVRDLLKQLSLR